MLKKIFLLMLGLALAACGNSLSDDLGPKTKPGNLSGDSKAAFTYVSYMYHPEHGKAINNAVLSDPAYAAYREDIQNALNVTMRFPLPDASGTRSAVTRSTETPWYMSMPAGFDLSAHGGDVIKALEAFLSTPEGQAYAQEIMLDYNQMLSTLDSYINADTFEDPKKTELEAIFQGTEIILSFASGNYAMGAIQMFSMISGLGGSDPVFDALKQIHARLVAIEKKLDRIESKINDLSDYVVYHDITAALNMIDSIYNQLSQNASNPVKQKEIIEEYIYGGTTANYENVFGKAYKAAQYVQYLVSNHDKAEKILVNGVSSQSSPDTTRKYYIPRPLHYMHGKSSPDAACGKSRFDCGMSLEEIQVMKRLSLTRLSLLATLYSGNELLTARRDMAQTDLSAYVANIRNNIPQPANSISNYVSSVEFAPFKFTLPLVGDYHYYVSDTNRNKNYKKSSDNRNESYRLAAQNFLRESLTWAIDNNAQDNNIASTFQDYTVAVAATVADWEIQLMAHIRAEEGL